MTKILVPVDSTPVVSAVLAAAVDEARWRGAELVLLRALGIPSELPLEAYALAPDQVAALVERSARGELDALCAQLPSGVTATVRVEYGAAWRVICDVARQEAVALVVIGAHGHRTLDGLLGTTASRVVTHLDRPLLVVRTPR
jgi:nucleotide-binding universal stress UspA family protein